MERLSLTVSSLAHYYSNKDRFIKHKGVLKETKNVKINYDLLDDKSQSSTIIRLLLIIGFLGLCNLFYSFY
ncbi:MULTISPECIES: hypothetical protein [unclassified Pseudoalteromonas]|uniref:hypothetical protein n=1 Tax=unclassified Pseudoalteromonas TaxID=194690 RepID=UPI000B3C9BAA|nr:MULTISPECIES: hypothetical protein [unclassified Pseudoalteromonas]MDN3379972.1 hypothetical protein [Pseudoalteromonas sp. APC 3893]MDN3388311.1 hypothetical protein [Pseudoalteromonas sp. APC 4017]OUS72107.1 hypothetical protein B5G52_09650 [Pseudoalteromonas sp. A601]